MNRTLKIAILATVVAFALGIPSAKAQHTVALVGGTGFASSRPYPAQEMRPIWGTYAVGVSWRYYSMPRFVGCIGVDVELMQRGYSFAPYPYRYESKKEYKYYTRKLNSIMIPLVWQPHIYLFKKHLRVYIEAAPTFSYNFGSRFYNEEEYIYTIDENGQTVGFKALEEGKYEFRRERDNRFAFGLAAGGGFDILFGQFEIGVRARYDLGFSDILRNRNKYYDNYLDSQNKPGENPFYYTPLRSPLDNLSISIKVGFRIGKAGFKEWEWKRPNFPRNKEVFKFAL